MTMATTRPHDKENPGIPDDLMTVAEIARALKRKRGKVQYHLKAAGLIRWERGATRLASLAEAKAYFQEWERVKPILENEDEEEEENDTER